MWCSKVVLYVVQLYVHINANVTCLSVRLLTTAGGPGGDGGRSRAEGDGADVLGRVGGGGRRQRDGGDLLAVHHEDARRYERHLVFFDSSMKILDDVQKSRELTLNCCWCRQVEVINRQFYVCHRGSQEYRSADGNAALRALG